MKVKLPEITIDDWLEAERSLKPKAGPQPEGTWTAGQFAEQRKVAGNTARQILSQMYKAGVVGREKWNGMYVYRLIKR